MANRRKVKVYTPDGYELGPMQQKKAKRLVKEGRARIGAIILQYKPTTEKKTWDD